MKKNTLTKVVLPIALGVGIMFLILKYKK